MKTMFALALFMGLGLVSAAAATRAEVGETGPHKMPVAEWGDEEYHLEVIPDAKAGTVTVYVYGNHAELDKGTAKPIDSKALVVSFKNPALTIKVDPSPQKGDPAGKASKFVGKSAKLGSLGKLEGTVSGKVGTKPYSGDFKQK